MVAFGIGALVLGINARNTVGDELKREFIVGSPDMTPAETEKAVQEAGLRNVEIPGDAAAIGPPAERTKARDSASLAHGTDSRKEPHE